MKYAAISLILTALPVLAAQKTWTGQISDSMCGANHAAMGDKHTACAAKCIKNGGPVGLATAGFCACYRFVAAYMLTPLTIVHAVDVPAASGRGAALLGAHAAGLLSFEEIQGPLAPTARLAAEPDPTRAAFHAERHARFRQIVSALRGCSTKGAT